MHKNLTTYLNMPGDYYNDYGNIFGHVAIFKLSVYETLFHAQNYMESEDI